MSERAFEVGDIVELKSGGPLMVVQQVYPGSKYDGHAVECAWFVSEEKREATFAEPTLKKRS